MDALLVSMKPSSVLSSVLALGLFVAGVPASAQQTNPDVMPPAGGNGPANDQGQQGPASTTMKGTGSTGGYSYADKPTAASAPRGRYRATGPTVAMPGFEQTADGGTRFFVQLSQSVGVEERKANGSVTYVLKGASPRVWNNTNSLVTVHFNTPVSRARLVPSGKDLLFVLDMRAAAAPTYKMNEAADKGAMLTIDFPKGDYVNAQGDIPTDENGVAVDGVRRADGQAPVQRQTTTPAPRPRTRVRSNPAPRVKANTVPRTTN